jgi:hypothetical protein
MGNGVGVCLGIQVQVIFYTNLGVYSFLFTIPPTVIPPTR